MKILVVDDESLARERLRRLLAKVAPEAIVVEAGDGAAALQVCQAEQPDLLLLDVRMPGMDGMAVAATLAAQPQPPAIIFCTAYDQHALDALRHNASAYLLKPVRQSELQEALAGAARINRVQAQQWVDNPGSSDAERSTITSQGHRGVEGVAVESVRCFMASDKYVSACHPDGSLLLQESLKELEQEFAGRFVRVHRNALVGLAHIQALRRSDSGGWLVVLEGVSERPAVSRRHLAAVKKQMSER